MNFIWFENFWIVSINFLSLTFCLPFCSFLVLAFSFSLSILGILSECSNSGAFAPFSNWDFEPYGWTFWRNEPSWVRLFSHGFGLKIRTSKFNLTFKAGLLRSLKKPTEGRILKKGSNWHFEFLPCW